MSKAARAIRKRSLNAPALSALDGAQTATLVPGYPDLTLRDLSAAMSREEVVAMSVRRPIRKRSPFFFFACVCVCVSEGRAGGIATHLLSLLVVACIHD